MLLSFCEVSADAKAFVVIVSVAATIVDYYDVVAALDCVGVVVLDDASLAEGCWPTFLLPLPYLFCESSMSLP